LWPLPDYDRLNHIAADNLVDDIHARYYSAKNCVTAVEVRLW
jgi:hypothetical protein